MRILFYNFSIPLLLSKDSEFEGGIAVELLNWMNAFRELNHEVALLTWKGAKDIIKSEVNFEIIESYNPDYGIPKLRMLYVHIPSVIRDIRKYKPDLIIQGGANLHCVIMGISSRITKKKFVHRIASDADVDNRTSELIEGIELFLYKKARRLVDIFSVQNEYQFKFLKKKFPNKNIIKIYNPFNGQIKSELLPRSDRSYIAWVGHFRKIKNLPALVPICSEFSNINIKIVGVAYSDLDIESANAIKTLEKMKNVEFLGYIQNSEIQYFLSKALCLLNTSFFEGFSNTFLEAWSVGTPVVTTIKANPDNLIGKNKIGLVANNHNDLVQKLHEILSYNENQYSGLSKRCYQYVRENHDPIKLAKNFLFEIEKN